MAEEKPMVHVFGFLQNGQMVIGRVQNEIQKEPTNFEETKTIVNEKLFDPALVQLMQAPTVNPITGQADFSKQQIGVACIMLPVSWIYRRVVEEIAHPNEFEEVVNTYKQALSSKIKKPRIN